MVVNLANALPEITDHPIHVVLARREGEFLEELRPEVHIVDLNTRRASRSVLALARYMRRERPLAVFSTLNYANVICLLAAILAGKPCPVIVREANVVRRQSGGFKDRVILGLMRLLYPRADRVVAICRDVEQSMLDAGVNIRNKIVRIGNPVRLDAYKDEGATPEWTPGPQTRFICAIGRLTEQKGFDILLEAFARLKHKDLHLAILGEGPLRKELELQAEELGIDGRVHLPGFVPNPREVTQRSELFVLSSRWEGFVNVLLEALAVGAPVVSTDCPGAAREILENGTHGHLVAPDDPEALARGIAEALACPVGTPESRMARAADFSAEKIAGKYLELVSGQLVCHIITGLNNGGAEGALYRLCRADRQNRHLVVSMMDGGHYGPLLQDAGIEVVCLNMRQGRPSLRGIYQLWRLLRQTRPDVVQGWMYHADLVGGLVARAAGVRRVFWGIRHSTHEVGKTRKSTVLVTRLCAWLSRWVPAGVVCCALRASEVHRKLGYFAEKLVVAPNGYDLHCFQPDQQAGMGMRKNWGVKENVFLLGMVARFHAQKDHESLFRALARLKKGGLFFRCALVGPGVDNDNSQLLAWREQYDLAEEILLLGAGSDIPAVMNALDLHVLSSSFGEAFPNVVAEAMACGTPCVATDVGDASLIVGETGWIVPPGDADSLAATIAAAASEFNNPSSPAWQQRRLSARQRVVENFSMEKMVANFHAVWRQGGVVV